MVPVQNGAGGLLELRQGLGVSRARFHFVALGGGQVALRLDHLEHCGFAKLKLLLLGIHGLAGEFCRFPRRRDLSLSLCYGDFRVAHVLFYQVLLLLERGPELAFLQKCGGGICLRLPVAEGYLQVRSQRIVGVVAV